MRDFLCSLFGVKPVGKYKMRADDNNNSVSTSPAHSFLPYLVIIFFKIQTLGLWESQLSLTKMLSIPFDGVKENLKTCHPAKLQNYKAKKKNLQSVILLNIWIFNSDLLTFRKVLLLGFKWGKNWLSLWFAVWTKRNTCECHWSEKRPELWQSGFYVTFSVLCLFYTSSWN